MATEIEYALMAGASYISNRSTFNRIPSPTGWDVVEGSYFIDPQTGFEAIAYTNGSEVVISYAGTDIKSDIDLVSDFTLATGSGSPQLYQAANYYLQIKAAHSNVTLTGHSLGGGLAALIGVFFGEEAYTFDQAPFANSAQDNDLFPNPLNILAPDVAANLKAYLIDLDYTADSLSGLTNFLQSREVNGGIPNAELITDVKVQGEFLSAALPYNLYDDIGVGTKIPNRVDGVAAKDLHSQALLTAYLQSIETAGSNQALNQATFRTKGTGVELFFQLS